MKANVGGIDRTVRIVAGLVLIGLAATGTVAGGAGWVPFRWRPACLAGVRRTRSSVSTPARPDSGRVGHSKKRRDGCRAS